MGEKNVFILVHRISEHRSPHTGSEPATPEGGRRVHSGPKERTKNLLEERGVGDGSELAPRVESRRYKAICSFI